jgi:hypothetical protein
VPLQAFGFDCPTKNGVMYRLESTTGLAAGSWTDTGIRLLGDGGLMTFHDPTGVSVPKSYRVAVEQ